MPAIYKSFKKNEPYNPKLYKKSDIIKINRDISVEQAVFILQRQGYNISKA